MDLKFELPLSSRALAWLFVILLLIFIAFRWHPDAVLKGAIEEFERSSGIDINYNALHLSGLTLQATGLTVKAKGMAVPIRFAQVEASPAWGHLITGDRAIDISAIYGGIRGDATLILREQSLAIESIRADGQASALPGLLQLPVPVELAGELVLQGSAEVDLVTGMATRGQFDIQWKSAVVRALGNEISGGSYVATIALQQSNSWQWQVDGGTALSVQGEGTVHVAPGPWQDWRCGGRSQLLNMSNQPLLSAVLPKGKSMNFTLSGTLGSPRIVPSSGGVTQ